MDSLPPDVPTVMDSLWPGRPHGDELSAVWTSSPWWTLCPRRPHCDRLSVAWTSPPWWILCHLEVPTVMDSLPPGHPHCDGLSATWTSPPWWILCHLEVPTMMGSLRPGRPHHGGLHPQPQSKPFALTGFCHSVLSLRQEKKPSHFQWNDKAMAAIVFTWYNFLPTGTFTSGEKSLIVSGWIPLKATHNVEAHSQNSLTNKLSGVPYWNGMLYMHYPNPRKFPTPQNGEWAGMSSGYSL